MKRCCEPTEQIGDITATINEVTSQSNPLEAARAGEHGKGFARQIVASAQQQTTGMEQIALAMQNIDQTTVQNLASTQQVEMAAQDLSSLAQQLEALVVRYKLN